MEVRRDGWAQKSVMIVGHRIKETAENPRPSGYLTMSNSAAHIRYIGSANLQMRSKNLLHLHDRFTVDVWALKDLGIILPDSHALYGSGDDYWWWWLRELSNTSRTRRRAPSDMRMRSTRLRERCWRRLGICMEHILRTLIHFSVVHCCYFAGHISLLGLSKCWF